MTADERLIAYVDEELSPQERAAFESQMACDPVLAAKVAAHRRLAARISGSYGGVLAEPVPPRLVAVASAANDSARRGPGPLPPLWAAMAACLVIGVLAGRASWPNQEPLVMRGGELVARGDLAKALSRQLASETGLVKIGLSFRARDGAYCRTFESPPERLAGLACRRDGRWVAQTATAWAPQAALNYRTAASATPPAVLAAVDATIAGEALDASAERAARDRGWKP